ncbi:N-acetylglucosamine-induced protein 1 [Madurella fahalii]|uniref:N-acetylglucosamine-induced protein 1 n=1 Tax=Madurella fahalii TaxID=1157608 RepID=A0ABQ0FY63_9PEZI
MGSTPEDLPYWQVNVPEHLRTAECPDFLRNLTDKDRGIINTPDSEYQIDSWPVVQQKVAQNRLELFRRVPSQLRRYLGFTWKLRQDYGSVMNFILKQRLGWTLPIVPKGRPFVFDEDIKILRNDWPYGIDERIVHLVVWTKFALEEDAETGDLTDGARAEIDAYVRKAFSKIPPDHVIWFKNWASLKSVKSVEHFHVMLFDPDPAVVCEITNGDVPLCERP